MTTLIGGVNLAYIFRQIGHRNPAMRLKLYSKWID